MVRTWFQGESSVEELKPSPPLAETLIAVLDERRESLQRIQSEIPASLVGPETIIVQYQMSVEFISAQGDISSWQ